MQGWKTFIPTEQKIKYLDSLLQVGFHTIDFGSFVSPKAIPQMQDTADVLRALDLSNSSSKLLAIVANTRGAETAMQFEAITYLGFPLSVSPTFQQRNTNASIEDALVRAEQFPNLYILPAGTRVENPSDLLERSPWQTLREQIADTFRFTILDCPPIGAVSEWDLLQAACDAVVVIAGQDHTQLAALLQAIESIPSKKLIGVVLNCVSDWLFARAHNAYEYPR